MRNSCKYVLVCVLAAFYAVRSSSLELVADSKLHKCPCNFRLLGYASDTAQISVQIVPSSTYTVWKNAGRPDSIVQSTSALRQGKFSANSVVNGTRYFALIVFASLQVSVKLQVESSPQVVRSPAAMSKKQVMRSKVSCPLRLKLTSRMYTASGNVRSVMRILNGLDLSTSTNFGYNAAINSDIGFCSGSIVAPQWVLTAAHCRVTEGNILHLGRDKHTVAVVHVHPEFSRRKAAVLHDLALIRLKEPVRDAHLRVIDIHSDPEQDLTGRYCRATGYGKDTRSGGFDYHLRAADLLLLSPDQCRRRLRARGLVNVPNGLEPASQLCVDGSECGTSACIGDSGGPLVASGRGGTPVQVGVMSFTVGGCTSLPDLYTKVALHADWIKRTSAGEVHAVRL